MIGSLFVFFARNVIACVGGFASSLLLIYFAAAVLGIPVWTRIALKVGKHRAFVLQTIYNLAALPLLFLLPHGQFGGGGPGASLGGRLNLGTPDALLRAMMSDVIDVDRLATGRNRSGLYFSFVTLTAKFGAAALVDAPLSDPSRGRLQDHGRQQRPRQSRAGSNSSSWRRWPAIWAACC